MLQAMHVPIEYAMGTIRFSVGRFTSSEEIERASEEIGRVIRNLQPEAPGEAAVDDGNAVRLPNTRMVWDAPVNCGRSCWKK